MVEAFAQAVVPEQRQKHAGTGAFWFLYYYLEGVLFEYQANFDAGVPVWPSYGPRASYRVRAVGSMVGADFSVKEKSCVHELRARAGNENGICCCAARP